MLNSIIKNYGGTNLEGALQRIIDYNSKNIAVSLSYLSVNNKDLGSIDEHLKEYKKAIDIIGRQKLNCDLTLKLNQFGIFDGKELCIRNLEPLIKHACEKDVFIWIDMEKSDTVPLTIEIFKELYKRHSNIGLCLQAYLKRTENDLREILINPSPRIRLVKGFYRENDFNSWQDVTENYSKLLGLLIEKGNYPGIATHDLNLIAETKRLTTEKRKVIELQMFAGVRDELAEQNFKEGFKTRIYLPYGNLWKFLIRGFGTFDQSRFLQRLIKRKQIK